MTDCLVYWKFFWEDLEDPETLNYDWYTKSEHFFKQVKPGDSLWVVVSAGSAHPDEWRLLQRIFIGGLKKEPQEKLDERPYHAIGDVQKSCYFDIKAQLDFASRLHKLEFVSGRKILAKGKLIGRSLQSIRPLSNNDSNLLKQYAKDLDRVSNVDGRSFR